MKAISFANLKGGVGKSNVLLNVTGILSEKKNKILVLDLDPQANTTQNFGFDSESIEGNAHNLFYDIKPAKEIVLKTEIEGVDLIAGTLRMTAVDNWLTGEEKREFFLRQFFKDEQDFLNEYDYVLMDTNPSFNIINQNVFTASDSIILITDTSINSLDGTRKFMQLWNALRKKFGIDGNIKALIVNKYDKRTKLDKEFMEYVTQDEQFRSLVIEPPIPNSVRYKEAELDAKPIIKGVHYRTLKKIVDKLYKKGVF